MATKIEHEDLNLTAGYSDRYTISRGGLCFCSYYGKLKHAKIGMEPLAIYDKIDELYGINDLPIIICFSGVIHDSGNVHGQLRALYLQDNSNIIVFALSFIGVLYSIYLTYLELFVIHAICLFCVISAIVLLLLLIITMLRLKLELE